MYRPLMVFLSYRQRSQAVATVPLRAGFLSALGFAAPLEPFDSSRSSAIFAARAVFSQVNSARPK